MDVSGLCNFENCGKTYYHLANISPDFTHDATRDEEIFATVVMNIRSRTLTAPMPTTRRKYVYVFQCFHLHSLGHKRWFVDPVVIYWLFPCGFNGPLPNQCCLIYTKPFRLNLTTSVAQHPLCVSSFALCWIGSYRMILITFSGTSDLCSLYQYQLYRSPSEMKIRNTFTKFICYM